MLALLEYVKRCLLCHVIIIEVEDQLTLDLLVALVETNLHCTDGAILCPFLFGVLFIKG